jgi:small subunit ribosomal protein S4e
MAITKRLEVPGFWPIEKKTKKYTASLLPGPHNSQTAFTLTVVIRDILKHAETMNEVKQILRSGAVKVNGRSRKEPGFPAGLMDVLTVGEEKYRVLPGKRGFYLRKIENKEAEFMLKKIKNRTTVKKGKSQLHFHDGTTMISEGNFRTGDVLVMDVQSGDVRDTIRQERGSLVIVIKGNNRGAVGTIDNIKIVKSPEPDIVDIKAGERHITLPLEYIFVIGRQEPVISLGEKNE